VLTNLLLLQPGFEFTPYISHERIIEKNKETYYSALNESQSTFKKEREDVSAWMLFFLEVIRAQVSGAAALIEKKEDMEIILSQK